MNNDTPEQDLQPTFIAWRITEPRKCRLEQIVDGDDLPKPRKSRTFEASSSFHYAKDFSHIRLY